MLEAILVTVIGGAVLGVAAMILRQPRPRAWLHQQFPSVRRLLGIGEAKPQGPIPSISELPSLEDLRRWQEFIEGYTLAADNPLGHVNLLFDPTYAEMEQSLSDEARKRVAGLTGIGLAFQAFGNPADEIKRLIYRDLQVVRSKVFKADPHSDDDGYAQFPPKSS